jgi:hypothetical protein
MNGDLADSDDRCPHCRVAFNIIFVKFGLRGTKMLAVCPNCSQAQHGRLKPPRPMMHSVRQQKVDRI